MRLEGWHIVIIIVLAIVLFGAPKLPGLARSVGQSMRIFKSEVKQMKDENTTDEPEAGPVEGRVVNNPAAGSYTPTHQDLGHGSTQRMPHRTDDEAGPAQQSGSSHTNR
ncbi:Sec-independent protein translocase subunit TatA [Arthrobacter echini]|nr:Sec-independent protein translocase subunit TatA [Arthrobacter echini]